MASLFHFYNRHCGGFVFAALPKYIKKETRERRGLTPFSAFDLLLWAALFEGAPGREETFCMYGRFVGQRFLLLPPFDVLLAQGADHPSLPSCPLNKPYHIKF